eukprot:2739710-Pyramimonas_sp.AAC.1
MAPPLVPPSFPLSLSPSFACRSLPRSRSVFSIYVHASLYVVGDAPRRVLSGQGNLPRGLVAIQGRPEVASENFRA